MAKQMKRHRVRTKVVWQSQESRAVTSYESRSAAVAAAKQMRQGLKNLGRAGKGVQVYLEKE